MFPFTDSCLLYGSTTHFQSKSLPFLPQPPNLVGVVGEVGECACLVASLYPNLSNNYRLSFSF